MISVSMKKIISYFFFFLKFILIISFALTCIFIMCSIIMYVTQSGNTNFQKLSENSFALFIAFAALFFSWGRGVFETNKILSAKLFGFGEWSFIISLLFLFTAILNYYKENSKAIFVHENWLIDNLNSVLRIAVPILFFTSFTCVFILFTRLIILLNKRFKNEQF